MHPPNPSYPLDQLSLQHHFPPVHPTPNYFSANPNFVLQLPTSIDASKPNFTAVSGINPAPPGTDQFLSVNYSHGVTGVYEHLQVPPTALAFTHYETIDGSSDAHNQAVREVLQQYGTSTLYATGGIIPQTGAQQLLPTVTIPTIWTNQTVRPRGLWKKVPKKTKIAQSAWCEVCKIECNTKDVLDQHKLGKKHLKNLDKLKAAAAPISLPAATSTATKATTSAALVAPAVPNTPVLIGPQEKPTKESTQKKKKAETVEDLETKKRKVLEGGAAANAVRLCGVCNVVCNSDVVFRYHLAGAKHLSMMKKLSTPTI